MLQMDLPHVNVLTKIDRVADYDPLPFNLDFYTEVQDLTYLMPSLESESPALRSDKFGRLNQAIADLVERFGLVSFEVLAVENKKSMMHLLRVIDRAGGYVFGSAEGSNDTIWQVAMRNESSLMDVQDIQERWIDNKEAYDEIERKEEEEQEKLREEQARAQAEATGNSASDSVLDGAMSSSSSTAPPAGIRVARRKK